MQEAEVRPAVRGAAAGCLFQVKGHNEGISMTLLVVSVIVYVFTHSTMVNAARAGEEYRVQTVERVAIMPFGNMTGNKAYDGFGSLVAERAAAAANRAQTGLHVTVFLGPKETGRLARELNIELKEGIDSSNAQEIGERLGIRSFVFGTLRSVSMQLLPESIATYQEEAVFPEGKDKGKKATATITAVTRGAAARCICGYKIVDVSSGTVAASGMVSGNESIKVMFGSFRGDSRALSDSSKALCAQNEAYPDTHNLVSLAVERAAKNMATEMMKFLRSPKH